MIWLRILYELGLTNLSLKQVRRYGQLKAHMHDKNFKSTMQITIEGTDAVDAAKALMDLSTLSGSWQTLNVDIETQQIGVPGAIATIVDISSGTFLAAKQIKKWYTRRKKANSGRTITKAVLVGNGKRVLLEGATVEDIKTMLESLD